LAVADHDADMVMVLLRRHADLEASDNEGARALHLAVKPSAETSDGERAARIGVQEALLAAGARVSATDASGATPLHWAALNGDLEFARLLLEHGADVEAQARGEGMTPLHAAAAGGDVDLVELLLERGADAGARDRAGRRPLDVARISNSAEAADVLRHHTPGAMRSAGPGDGERVPRRMEPRPRASENRSAERPQSIA
jgi:ankyrin repeat protein